MNLQNFCNRWYSTFSGKASLDKIDELCGDVLSEIFGYYALEIGELSGKHDLLTNSRIAAGFSLIQKRSSECCHEERAIVGSCEQLPISTDNVDLVIASHALEFSKDPHQVLREIDRILVPEGHCILIGFNPFSIHRAVHFMRPKSYSQKDPEQRMRSAHRVRDWFSLLGFEVLDLQYLGFRPAVKSKVLFDRMGWLDKWGEAVWPILGNLYVIHAKKQVIAMRPDKKVWRAPAVLTGGKVALNNTARKIRQQNFSGL